MSVYSKLLASVASVAMASAGLTAAAYAQATTVPDAAPMAQPAAGADLSTVVNPKQTLRGAHVTDAKGEAVGEVSSVQIGNDGKIASLKVAVGTKTVALNAEGLTYQQANNTIVSAKTKAEIEKLPPA